MNVAQLRKVLEVSERHHREVGESDVANGLATFANLLSKEGPESVAAFVKRVERVWRGSKFRKAGKTRE